MKYSWESVLPKEKEQWQHKIILSCKSKVNFSFIENIQIISLLFITLLIEKEFQIG